MFEIILCSSGGSGHLSAAKTEEKKYPSGDCELINITEMKWLNFEWLSSYGLHYLPFTSWMYFNYGQQGIEEWNKAQKEGDLAKLNQLIKAQPLANKSFGPNFYNKMLELLRKKKAEGKVVTGVTTTQPIGIASIHQAIAQFNQENLETLGKISLKVIFTDIPTEYLQGTSFLRSLEEIDLNLIDSAPLILELPYHSLKMSSPCLVDQHEAFAKLCSRVYEENSIIPKKNITIYFTPGPLDKEFSNSNKTNLHLQFTSSAYQTICKELPKFAEQLSDVAVTNPHTLYQQKPKVISGAEKRLDNHIKEDYVPSPSNIIKQLRLPSQVKIITIMLGSAASYEGTLLSIKEEYKIYNELKQTDPVFLFVFCGDDTNKNTLFNEVCSIAKNYASDPKFHIYPLTHQNKDVVNQLYRRAKVSVTRPGGMTVMELRAVSKALIVIYAEKGKNASTDLATHPEMALVGWEQGNAIDLQNKFGPDKAIVVNKHNYYDLRKRQENYQPIPNSLQLLDTELTNKLSDDLKSIGYRLHTNDVDLKIILLGYAIYLTHVEKTDIPANLTTMLIFGKNYAEGCRIFAKQNTNELSHPYALALRYAKVLLNMDQDTINLSKEENVKEQKIRAANYINTLYDVNKGINFEILLSFSENYSKELQKPHPIAIHEAYKIYTENQLKESEQNNKKMVKEMIAKIKQIFQGYSSYLHMRRSHFDAANNIILDMSVYENRQGLTLEDLYDYLLKCKKNSIANEKGTFIQWLDGLLRDIKNLSTKKIITNDAVEQVMTIESTVTQNL